MRSATWGRLALSTFAVACGGEAAVAACELRHRMRPAAKDEFTAAPAAKQAALGGGLAAGLLSLRVPGPVLAALWHPRHAPPQLLHRGAAVMRICRASLTLSLGLSFVAGLDHGVRVMAAGQAQPPAKQPSRRPPPSPPG